MTVKCPQCLQIACVHTEGHGEYCWKCGYYQNFQTGEIVEKKQKSHMTIGDLHLYPFEDALQNDTCVPYSGCVSVVDYLFERGLHKEDIFNTHKMLYCLEFPMAVAFPVYSKDGIITCVNLRFIDKTDNQRYKSFGDRETAIYNPHKIRRTKGINWAVLTEGPIDAICTPHGISTFGIGVSKAQYRKLNKLDLVLIAFDGDKMGRFLSHKVAKRLTTHAYVINLPAEKDPADVGTFYMTQLIKKSFHDILGL